jgi:hypothetical protein
VRVRCLAAEPDRQGTGRDHDMEVRVRILLQTWGRDEKEAGILYRAHAASR